MNEMNEMNEKYEIIDINENLKVINLGNLSTKKRGNYIY